MSKVKVKRLNSVLFIEEADLKKYEARGFKVVDKKAKGEAKDKGDKKGKDASTEAKDKGDANEGKENQ